MGYEVLAATGRLFRHRFLRLTLGADEQDRLPLRRHARQEVHRLREQPDGLLQVEDEDTAAHSENVGLHARMPALLLVSEVRSRLQEVAQRH